MHMPVLAAIRERFAREKPLAGVRIGACLHVTTETANLMRTLKAGGADIVLCASNPLSTQDDVAAALVAEYGIRVFAIKGEDDATYYAHINAAVDHRPNITMDDGADVIGVLHGERPDMAADIIGGTEETTTGVIRLKAMEAEGAPHVPDRRRQRRQHQAHVRQPLRHRPVHPRRHRARHQHPARRHARSCVAGYGWCGRGLAMRVQGHGRRRHRHRSRPAQAPSKRSWTASGSCPWPRRPRWRDLFVTVTGDIHVIRKEHFEVMKDGAIVSNTGHFNVEIDIPALEALATEQAPRARVRRRVHHGRRPADLPAGRGPARQPVGRRRPSGGRHGHELRQPGAGGRVHGGQARRAREARSTRCRPTSTPRSPASSSRPWASPSTRSPTSRPSTWPPGTRVPELSTAGPQHKLRIETVEIRPDAVVLIDQLALPHDERYVTCTTWREVAGRIRDMTVRGAPAIGVAAAGALALAAREAAFAQAGDRAAFNAALDEAAAGLAQTRPTAVNLTWAIAEMRGLWQRCDAAPEECWLTLLARAREIHDDDIRRCYAIGAFGAPLSRPATPSSPTATPAPSPPPGTARRWASCAPATNATTAPSRSSSTRRGPGSRAPA